TAIRDALAATKEFPGVTGNVTFNENRDAVKPIIMIEIKDGGTYAVRERVQVEGAAVATTAASPATSPDNAGSPATGASPATSTASPAKAASPPVAASPAKPVATATP
ncbi:MAG: hypothetical protein M3539_02680, partial [Acidobacteriota bacterium]|nr:hypothetical protein [Acidobacteriota bacterium]